MKILVIFPQNNTFSNVNTKPVVLAAYSYIKDSIFKSNIKVVTPYTNSPFYDINSIIIPEEHSTKQNYINKVLTVVKEERPKIVEVHQDIELAGKIAKLYPDIAVSVVKHNNYLKNSFKEKFKFYRKWLYKEYLTYIKYIYCISYYVKKNIDATYPKLVNKTCVFYNTYGHIESLLSNNYTKENIIIFAGKPVENKGFIPFMESLPTVLEKNPTWNAMIIGAVFSNKDKYLKTYYKLLNKKSIKSFIQSGRIIVYEGISNKEVFYNMQSAKISVVPTITEEPFGLVALESHMAHCAVISSGTGGLIEISKSNAEILEAVEASNIASAIQKLIDDDVYLDSLANKGYDYCYKKFSPNICVKMLDNQRMSLGK